MCMNSALLYLFREPFCAKLSRLLPYCVSRTAAYYPAHASDARASCISRPHLNLFSCSIAKLHSCRSAIRGQSGLRRVCTVHALAAEAAFYPLPGAAFFYSFARHRILCWQIFYLLLWRAKTHFPYPTLPKIISNFFHVVTDAHICVQPLHLRWWPNTPRASLASEIPLSLHNFRTSALAFVVALTPLSHTLNEARLQKRGKHMRYADTLSYSCEKRMQRKKR